MSLIKPHRLEEERQKGEPLEHDLAGALQSIEALKATAIGQAGPCEKLAKACARQAGEAPARELARRWRAREGASSLANDLHTARTKASASDIERSRADVEGS